MKLIKTIAFVLCIFSTFLANAQETGNQTPGEMLMVAADEGDSVQVLILIRAGVNVNSKTYEGITPLMFAVQRGYLSIVRILVENGAKLDMAAFDGNTALMMAVKNGYYYIAEYLLSKGADVNAADDDNLTPLMQAIVIDSFYFPDLVIGHGADIHKRNRNGKNALMLAVEHGRFEIAFRLLEEGADINSTENRGNTPLHFAAFNGQAEIVELLMLNGAEPEAVNFNKYTPLAVAVAENQYEAVRSLISYGADVNARINRSQNIISLAISNKNDSVRKLLEVNGAEIMNRINFNKVAFGVGDQFNRDDQFLNLTFGLTDSRFHLMPGITYGLRPTAIRVMEETGEGTYYQYWERRHLLTFSLDKGLLWNDRKSGFTTGAFVGIGGTLTYGAYRGAEAKPETRFVVSPRAGCLFEFGATRIKAYYQFTNLHLKNHDRHWVGITIEFLIRNNPANRIIR